MNVDTRVAPGSRAIQEVRCLGARERWGEGEGSLRRSVKMQPFPGMKAGSSFPGNKKGDGIHERTAQ